MRSQNWRAHWLIAFAGAATFLFGSFVVASFVTDRLRTAGAIALSGAVSFGIAYLGASFRARLHQGK